MSQKHEIWALQLVNGDVVIGYDPQPSTKFGQGVISVIPVNIHEHDVTGERFCIKAPETPPQMCVIDKLMIIAHIGKLTVYDNTLEAKAAFDEEAERVHAAGQGGLSAVPHIHGEDPPLGTDQQEADPEGASA